MGRIAEQVRSLFWFVWSMYDLRERGSGRVGRGGGRPYARLAWAGPPT